jgi:hypothetical protein
MCLERAVVRAEYTIVKTVSASLPRLQAVIVPYANASSIPTLGLQNQVVSPLAQAYTPINMLATGPACYVPHGDGVPSVQATDCVINWPQQTKGLDMSSNNERRDPSAPPQNIEDDPS